MQCSEVIEIRDLTKNEYIDYGGVVVIIEGEEEIEWGTGRPYI